MRILAIRGKNLASLAKDFEVLLEEGALLQVGLFAITGPTGAGKSTILDALCLALYDQMPRLPEGHGVAIGHQHEDEAIRVKSHDVSSILRRGTASAYAEVDFIGKDKDTYRARWEISRARGKVDGRLQAQKISLQNLNSKEKIGQGKKETQQEIEAKIGLNFDQFRRSVLLAQGDFAAFLKAKKDERSSLLEKITGTDIYSELSIAAFERAKEEKQQLERIEEKLADKVPLDTEARTKLEREKEQIAKQLTAVQNEIKDKQKIIDWFTSLATLKKEQQEAQGKVQLAQDNWANNAADRKLLEQVEQAQPLRPLLQQEQTLAKELKDAELKLGENHDALAEAEQTLAKMTNRVAEYKQAYASSKQQHTEAQPLLIVARKLDTQIDDSHSRLNVLAKETASQKDIWQAASMTFDTLNRQKDQQENTRKQLAIWQEQHANIQALANEWVRWETEIKEYITLEQTLQQDQLITSVLQENISQQQSKFKVLQTQNAKTLEEKNTLSDQLSRVEKQANELSLSDLHQQKSQLESQKESIDMALSFAEKGLAQQTSLMQDQDALKVATSSIHQANAQIEQLHKEQASKQIQLQEAQQAFN